MVVARLITRARVARRRGFTLIELIVAMAVLAILIAGGIQYFSGQIAQAHTHSMMQTMDGFKTGIAVFQGYDNTGGYPEQGNPASDTTLADGTANSGAASYAAFVADLNTVGVQNLPTYASVFSNFTYEPTDTTTPPSYTLTATAVGGTTDVICVDPVNGVVDLGAGGTPKTAGVVCQ